MREFDGRRTVHGNHRVQSEQVRYLADELIQSSRRGYQHPGRRIPENMCDLRGLEQELTGTATPPASHRAVQGYRFLGSLGQPDGHAVAAPQSELDQAGSRRLSRFSDTGI